MFRLTTGWVGDEVAVGDRHLHRIGQLTHEIAALEPKLDLTRAGAAVAVLVVAVVALLVVVGQDHAVAAAGLAAVRSADGFYFAKGVAAVTDGVVAVVAGLVPLFLAIAADRLFASASDCGANEAELSAAGVRAAVATGWYRVAVFAFLFAGKNAVAAKSSDTLLVGHRASPARLHRAIGGTAVCACGVPVVAALFAADKSVSADNGGDAGLIGGRTGKVLLDGLAVACAAIAGLVVSIVADLSRLDDAVAAAGGVELPAGATVATACPARRRADEVGSSFSAARAWRGGLSAGTAAAACRCRGGGRGGRFRAQGLFAGASGKA